MKKIKEINFDQILKKGIILNSITCAESLKNFNLIHVCNLYFIDISMTTYFLEVRKREKMLYRRLMD
jgi:hypothetical protein